MTPEQIAALRADHAADHAADMSVRALAAKHGVPRSTVHRLVSQDAPQPAQPTAKLVDGLRQRAETPAQAPRHHGQGETYEMLRAELGRLKEMVTAGSP